MFRIGILPFEEKRECAKYSLVWKKRSIKCSHHHYLADLIIIIIIIIIIIDHFGSRRITVSLFIAVSPGIEEVLLFQYLYTASKLHAQEAERR